MLSSSNGHYAILIRELRPAMGASGLPHASGGVERGCWADEHGLHGLHGFARLARFARGQVVTAGRLPLMRGTLTRDELPGYPLAHPRAGVAADATRRGSIQDCGSRAP